jgi:outer membrane protein TolC
MKKIRRKRLLISVQLLCIINSVFSQTYLEQLWKRCRNNNTDIITADIYVQQAENALLYSNIQYEPSLSVAAESSFTDSYKTITGYPSSAVGTLSWSKTFPGSTSFSTALGYSVSRSFVNLFSEINPDNTGYSKSPEVSLSLTQGMYPYWIYGIEKDPYYAQLEYAVEQKRQNRNITEISLLESVTDAYIQVRKYKRLIDMTEKSVSFYDMYIDSLSKAYTNGTVEIAKVWEQENNRWTYVENLSGYQDSYDAAVKTLALYCSDIDDIDFEGVLPAYDKALFSENPEKQLIEAERQSLKCQFIQNMQSNAPSVCLKGSLSDTSGTVSAGDFFRSWGSTDTYEWSITLSVNISPLFSNKKKLLEKNYQYDSDAYRIQERSVQEKKEKSDIYYDRKINESEAELKKVRHMDAERSYYYENSKKLYAQGKCAELDVLNADVQFFTSCSILNNCNDMLWYYRWMKTQNN